MADTKANAKSGQMDLPGCDLGILFVHGVGEQARGDTLVRFGEPIMRWVQRWIQSWSDEKGKVSLENAYIEEGSPEFKGPAHFVASIDVGGKGAVALSSMVAQVQSETLGTRKIDPEGNGRDVKLEKVSRPSEEDRSHPEGSTRRWMVAESWWAGQFQRPPFGTFARWMLSRGPWVILSHFGGKLRSVDGWRKCPAFFAFLMAMPVAVLAQIIVAVIAILALIPLPRLREALSGLLLKLTGTLGDSYVLTESAVQQSAAVTQVRRDLEWLTAH
jgi:hypothetical protein